MKAIVLKKFGSTENFSIENVDEPVLNDDEILIKVKSISVNPVDVKTRSGKGIAESLKNIHPLILGWDVSGTVINKGKKANAFEIGNNVFGMINFPGNGKTYAEYVAAKVTHVALMPDNISFDEAAASTLAALTAWQGLINVLNIKSGDRILIHAASGGVGHFAVQIARHFGAYAIGTSSELNKQFVLNLGADEFIDYKKQPLTEAINNIDKVFDTIGGDNIDTSLEVMKPGGIILSIPSGKNDDVEKKAAAKGMTGKKMVVQSSGADEQKIAELLEKKIIKAHVSKTFEFNEMTEAHKQIESGHTIGKIVVNI